MEMSSSRSVPATVDTVWTALNDPEVLKACIPGCESIEPIAQGEYRVAMSVRVGPVNAKFSGRIVLSDIVPPNSYTLSFDGQGGGAGFANGSARVALVPEGSNTRIDYKVNARVGGKLAQIGSRLIDGAASKVADDFFGCFVERVGGKPSEVPTLPEAVPVWKNMWVRLAIAIVIIVAMAIFWLARAA